MNTKNKYRLGNQNEEYELVTKYLGWLPEGKKEWFHFLHPRGIHNDKEKEVIIVSPNEKEKINLIIHREVTKDAFPLSFYKEERAEDWNSFCIVSTKNNPTEKFIIPLH